MTPSDDDDDLQRLRAENDELRLRTQAQEHDNALLLNMMADVVSSLDLDRVLRHIVEHLVSVAGCHGGFIYLSDAYRRRLVLRAATNPYRHVAGRIELAFGEGLVGWAATTKRPVVLRERAMDDPRFRYFPELDEESFQAMLVVPLLNVDGSVVAVISMHTIAPQEFTDEHVRLVEALAPILGAAIRAAELVESAGRRLDILAAISRQVQAVRGGRYLDDSLQALAVTILGAVQSDTCILVVTEPGLDDLFVRSYNLSDGTCTVATDTLGRRPWAALAAALTPSQPGAGPALTVAGSPAAAGATITAPLVVAGEQLGLLVCYRRALQPYEDPERIFLAVVAGQVATAIRNSQIAAVLAERDLPARLIRALIDGVEDDADAVTRRAALLGCDLTRPHIPVIVDLATPAGGNGPDATMARGTTRRAGLPGPVGRTVGRLLAETYPGSLVYAGTSVHAIVRLPDTEREAIRDSDLAGICDAMAAESGLALVAGIGSICSDPRDYRRGFAEAGEAIRAGRALRRRGPVHFAELGAYRYLSLIPAEADTGAVRDRYQLGVERLAAHDTQKGTELVHTLTTYLACGGNLTRTSEQLYVHRNTLDQRLEKVRDLLALDPRDSAHWLALHIALALHDLHRA